MTTHCRLLKGLLSTAVYPFTDLHVPVDNRIVCPSSPSLQLSLADLLFSFSCLLPWGGLPGFLYSRACRGCVFWMVQRCMLSCHSLLNKQGSSINDHQDFFWCFPKLLISKFAV